ncbi:hypothetical protein ACOSQ4_011008 [Xanthoceras sorbifolium]
MVSKRLKLIGLVELIYQKFNINNTRYDIAISTVVWTHNPRKLQILGDDDVAFLLQERTLNIPEVYIDLVEKVDNNVTDPPPFGTQFSAAGGCSRHSELIPSVSNRDHEFTPVIMDEDKKN